MIINFYRSYGIIFFFVSERKSDCVFYANTTNDAERKLTRESFIPTEHKLTDRQARIWFKENYPDFEIHKIDKHYHTHWRDKDGDQFGD